MLGGDVYSQLVGHLVRHFSTGTLMVGGGLLAAAGLLFEATVPPWPQQAVIFLVMGMGFYTLHACILIYMTELAPEARGTSVAGHALSYFSGQALGPVVYGFGFATIGASATLVGAAVAVAAVGIVTTWLLQRIGRRAATP
jgi:predicted MFS family arabinose efflux permease